MHPSPNNHPKAPLSNKCPHRFPITFLDSKDTRKTCYYCHLLVIDNFSSFNFNIYMCVNGITGLWYDWLTSGGNLNPLSPNSDQHQFSPKNTHMLPREMVTRVKKLITKWKMLWSIIKFSQLILKGDVWLLFWRICNWISGLKGLISNPLIKHPPSNKCHLF